VKALVTGGAGFIGSHLVDELIRMGHEVYVIDDLSTGRLVNVEHLQDSGSCHIIIDTILNKRIMRELVEECDMIYHLAAAVGVKYVMDDPIRTIATNVNGAETVLALAGAGKKKTLITSSSEVYGKGGTHPHKEHDDTLAGPTTSLRWSYSYSKAVTECLALAYWYKEQLPVVIVRLFNTIGQRQIDDYGMVVPSFVKRALLGEPITIYGNGKQSRCFAGVKDVVKGLIALGNHPGAVGEIFNLGGQAEITIEELARKIKALTGSKSEIVKISYTEAYGERFADMDRRAPDISKVKRLIGYNPNTRLDDILNEIIEYHECAMKETAL
jgi:UDP-glucose 4-epimerase